MRTDQGVPATALMVALAVSKPRHDLDGSLQHPFHLGQGLSNPSLNLCKRLRRLHPVVADAFEAFGKDMLHLCGEHNYVARMTQVAMLS